MKYILLTALIFTPVFVFAQTFLNSNVNYVLDTMTSILASLIPVLIGLAALLFFWGLIRYLTTTNENTRKEAINVIIYGIITLFVMVAIWGLVNIIAVTFDVDITSGTEPSTITESIDNLKN